MPYYVHFETTRARLVNWSCWTVHCTPYVVQRIANLLPINWCITFP